MNMKEIAQLAGVTAATVSNAINGTGNVSEKKRKEIMEIIEREGYSPNRFAKSLRTKESNTIGIMVEERFRHHGSLTGSITTLKSRAMQ